MRLKLEPVHDVPPDLVKDYLARRGWNRELIEWKYFDARFNRGRPRGFVWIDQDRVRGLIGMIPARMARNGMSLPVYWACDWSVEEHEKRPGVGVFLFQEAARTGLRYIGIGGNENSLKYFPRLAIRHYPEAAIEYHIPLRLGVFLEKAGRRLKLGRVDQWPLIGRIPLPRHSARRGNDVATEEGLPTCLASLVESPRGEEWHPVYDWEHLHWEMGRAPGIKALSTRSPASGPPRAAVIYWRTRGSTRRWHATLWCLEGADDSLGHCLSEALRRIDAAGGWRLTTLVSRRDEDFVRVLESRGALRGRPEPFFLFKTDESLAGLEEPTRLGYHDSDYPVLY